MKLTVSIVITSYKEPNLNQAIESFLNQKIDYPYELIVADPGIEAKKLVEYIKSKGDMK